MLPLYLVGTGGLAREIYGWMVHEKSELLALLKGFVITSEKEDNFIYGLPVLHIDEINEPFNFIASIGSGNVRKKIVAILAKKNGTPISYIHKSAAIGMNVSIGAGCIVNPRSSISSNVQIGDFVLINCNVGIGHDSTIGNYVTLLGDNAVNGNVVIKENVTIGSGAVIHPNKSIGSNATVAIGSVVLK